MKKSYQKKSYLIIELLQSFTEKEWKGFEQYLSCGFINTNEKLIILLKLLRKEMHRFDSADQFLKLMHEKLFGVKLNNSIYLTERQKNNVQAKISILLKLAQDFLQLLALRTNEKVGIVLLQQQLLERKQFRLYKQRIKKWIRRSESETENVNYFEHQFFVSRNQIDYVTLQAKKDLSLHLQSLKYNLNMFYLLNQLDYYLVETSLSTQSKLNEINHQSLNVLKHLLELSPYNQHPLLKIYRLVIELFEDRTEPVFLKLVKLLDELAKEVHKDSLANFYYSLINFCVSKSYEGENIYKKHQIEMYRIMDEKNLLLLENNQMQIADLRNMVLQSCRIDEFDWAIHIVNKYYKHINKKVGNDVKAANLGIIAFYQNQYQQAIDYLFPLQSINLAYDVNRRTIMMKCYYELDENYLETTHQLYRSFETYIQGNKVLTSKSKTSYKNFIRTLINLYRIKHSVTKMQLESVKIKLKAQKLNSNKSWLEEKMGELK